MGKSLPALPLNRFLGQRKQSPAYPWLMTQRAESDRKSWGLGGGGQGLSPTQGRSQVGGWLVVVRRCPSVMDNALWETWGAGAPHGEKGPGGQKP